MFRAQLVFAVTRATSGDGMEPKGLVDTGVFFVMVDGVRRRNIPRPSTLKGKTFRPSSVRPFWSDCGWPYFSLDTYYYSSISVASKTTISRSRRFHARQNTRAF